jgi:hypothetical protein
MKPRRRFKQTRTLEQRLTDELQYLRQEASKLPPCLEREHLLRKARHVEAASRINGWLTTPGLRSPT